MPQRDGHPDEGASASADGVSWDDLQAPTGGSTDSVSFDELDRAVGEAVTTLLEAPVVEAGQVTIRGDTVHASSWTRFVDQDTYEHVAFRPTSPVPSVDDPVEVLATVVTGGEVRWAEDASDTTWRTGDARPPDPFGIDLPAMASGVMSLDLGPDVRATVREAPDGPGSGPCTNSRASVSAGWSRRMADSWRWYTSTLPRPTGAETTRWNLHR